MPLCFIVVRRRRMYKNAPITNVQRDGYCWLWGTAYSKYFCMSHPHSTDLNIARSALLTAPHKGRRQTCWGAHEVAWNLSARLTSSRASGTRVVGTAEPLASAGKRKKTERKVRSPPQTPTHRPNRAHVANGAALPMPFKGSYCSHTLTRLPRWYPSFFLRSLLAYHQPPLNTSRWWLPGAADSATHCESSPSSPSSAA